MKRIFFVAVAIFLCATASADTQSKMIMKKDGDVTKVTCTYWMPEIQHDGELFFEFIMNGWYDGGARPFESYGGDSFQFFLSSETNRYVEFGVHGTKFILRKTTKGTWKIAMVRNFNIPQVNQPVHYQGVAHCGGFIRPARTEPPLTDFSVINGQFTG